MKEISIIAATFYGNRGAEAMLSTTIGRMREIFENDLLFNVYTYYPERDRELINDSKVVIHSSKPVYLVLVLLPCAILFRLFGLFRLNVLQRYLPQSLKAITRSKALVCLAGVSFIDGRNKFIPFNVATVLPAMIVGVPVIKFSQAMGPFRSTINKVTAKFLLKRCRQIFARGKTTNSYLQELFGVEPLFQRADDIAFLFKPEFCLSRPSTGIQGKLMALSDRRKTGKTIIGICPSAVIAIRANAAGWNYSLCIQMLINCLVNKGYAVALYPNATRGEDMKKHHNNDLPLLQTILKDLSPQVRKHIVEFVDCLNVKQILSVIEACDVHAVSRFHAMVASLASAIPVMVIGWSHKYLEVMESFGQEDMVIDYANGNIEPILSYVERLISERFKRSEQISLALPSVRQLSNVQIDYLSSILKKTA